MMIQYVRVIFALFLLVLSTAQASALFVSADPLAPNLPGVGTNRYAYSHSDPINLSDPSGLATQYYSDGRDPVNFHPDSAEHAAVACGCPEGARHLAEWERNHGALAQEFIGQGYENVTYIGGGIFTGYGYASGGVRIPISVRRNSPLVAEVGGAIVGGAGQGSRLGPWGAIAGAVLAAGNFDHTRRTNLTYLLHGLAGAQYAGRTSGYGTPLAIAQRRYLRHNRLRAMGFTGPTLDVFIQGTYLTVQRDAIRGREQQLIDFIGGVGNPLVANRVRGVARANPFGSYYHGQSNRFFGGLHPYTGY